jgi:hypothetical protein
MKKAISADQLLNIAMIVGGLALVYFIYKAATGVGQKLETDAAKAVDGGAIGILANAPDAAYNAGYSFGNWLSDLFSGGGNPQK